MKCIITGANSGLGKELVKLFKEDYDVIEITREDGDLRDNKTLDLIYNKAEDLSLLINNAGIPCMRKPFEQLTESEIEETLSSLSMTIKLTHKLYPILKKNNGAIINMNSICGLENRKDRNVYDAIKWGLRGFTDSLRLEGLRNVGVYITQTKTRPELMAYGLDPLFVAKTIFRKFKETDEIVLDGRPNEYKNCQAKKR